MRMSITKSLCRVVIGFGLAVSVLSAQALEVLLVNDDGYQAIGIDIMRNALEKAGHKVYLVAPATDQSGKGMSFSTSTLIETLYYGERRATSVSGTPVDAVRVGLWLYNDTFKRQPDLVVSGINFGANAGTISNSSGTVGGATWALMQGIPAIAVSANSDAADTPPYPLTAKIMESAAQTVVALITRLQQTSGTGPLMAPYTGLNVNFPALVTPKGLVMAQLGLFNSASLPVRPVANPALPKGLTFAISQVAVPVLPANPRWDTDLIAAGYATIAPINGDWSGSDAQRSAVQQRLSGFASPEGSITP